MRSVGAPRRRRVPVVLQMTVNDCGIACLAMVLRHHGCPATLMQCRERIAAGRDGVTAAALVTAARSFGLRVSAFAGGPAAIEQLALPAIVHWETSHYVVLERLSAARADIVDPALGRRRLTAEEFVQGFGGLVLAFAPTAELEGRGPVRRPTRASWPAPLRGLLAGCRPMLATMLAASLVLQLLGLALPLAIAVVIDRVVTPRDGGLLPVLAVGITVLTVTQLFAGHVRGLLLVRLQARVHGQITRALFRHLLSLPYSFFQQRANGDLMQRLSSSAILRELVTTQALAAVLDGGFMLVYLVLLLAADLALGGFVLAVGLIQVALLLAVRGRAHQLQQRHLLAQAAAQTVLFEALCGVATVKATGSEERLFQAWSERFSAELRIDADQNRLGALVENATATLRVFAPLALVWIGAHRVLDGTLSLGTMIALQTLAIAFLIPLAALVESAQRLQSVRAHLERFGDVLDAAPEQTAPAARPTPRLSGKVELRAVEFRYDPASPLVLRDISVTIEAGQKVALVGRSGSGKSSLALLLLGLYTPDAGDILYDDIPLAHLECQAVRSQFGVVLQESFVFGDSIRRNIAGNEPGLPMERAARAAATAALDGDIARMPMGYETRLGDGGAGLSGGQRQRLALARAVARDPALLLLDEATSHLDVLTEARVDANLDALSCTRVVIAHRVSTVRNADLILVLDDGEIVERGSHDELIAQEGMYARLVAGQGARAEGQPTVRAA